MRGGCLIVKCFDTTERPTLDLLWLVSRAFCEWGLVKPRTSRAGNAERYFVGKGFLGRENVDDITRLLKAYQEKREFTLPILAHVHNKPMLASIAHLQEQIEHVEIHVIRETLDLIKRTEQSVIRSHVRGNVIRSLKWCKEHKEDISSCWITEFDKNVQKETMDLLNILSPAKNITYAHPKPNTNVPMSFEKFRTGVVEAPHTNPFMRVSRNP
jgi:hypothetical protein